MLFFSVFFLRLALSAFFWATFAACFADPGAGATLDGFLRTLPLVEGLFLNFGAAGFFDLGLCGEQGKHTRRQRSLQTTHTHEEKGWIDIKLYITSHRNERLWDSKSNPNALSAQEKKPLKVCLVQWSPAEQAPTRCMHLCCAYTAMASTVPLRQCFARGVSP